MEDQLYLGLRQKRVSDKEMTEFMDEFVESMAEVFPKVLIQFEDFSTYPLIGISNFSDHNCYIGTEHAFFYLDRYAKTAPAAVFNDDIQVSACLTALLKI